jgi:hypothetical protein
VVVVVGEVGAATVPLQLQKRSAAVIGSMQMQVRTRAANCNLSAAEQLTAACVLPRSLVVAVRGLLTIACDQTTGAASGAPFKRQRQSRA